MSHSWLDGQNVWQQNVDYKWLMQHQINMVFAQKQQIVES